MSAEDEHSTLKQFFRHLLAGAIAGCVSRTVTAPIDRIKVFVQVSKHPQNYQDLVRQLYKDGGVWSFWRGNWINVVKSAPKSSLRFAFYEQIKIGIKKEDELSIQERIIAGSVSGWLSQTLIYPLEVVKTKMTLRSTGQYEGIMHCFKKVYRTEGLKAFGRGYFPTLLTIIPHSGLDLACYETMKLFAIDHRKTLNNFDLFMMSSISSFTGQTLAYPLLLVSTKMQASKQLESMVRILRDLWNQHGIKGLYRGFIPSTVKFLPITGFTFVTYEYVIKRFGVFMTL